MGRGSSPKPGSHHRVDLARVELSARRRDVAGVAHLGVSRVSKSKTRTRPANRVQSKTHQLDFVLNVVHPEKVGEEAACCNRVDFGRYKDEHRAAAANGVLLRTRRGTNER